MQAGSTCSYYRRSCEGPPQQVCQGHQQRPCRSTLSAHHKSLSKTCWMGTSVRARQPPLHLPRQRIACLCAANSDSSDSSDSLAQQRRKLEALFSAKSVDSPGGAWHSRGMTAQHTLSSCRTISSLNCAWPLCVCTLRSSTATACDAYE